jgi:hypothetical protein
VHLTRDEDAVARSYLARWDSRFSGGIIMASPQGILMTAQEWPASERLDVCRFYVQTVNTSIREFIRNRPVLSVSIENIREDFDEFLRVIGGDGDLTAAREEWEIRHNSS